MDTAAAAAAEERNATESYDQWEQRVRDHVDRALAWPPPDIAALMQQPSAAPPPPAVEAPAPAPPAPEPETMETTSTSTTSNGKANGMHKPTAFKPKHPKKSAKLPEHGSKGELCFALAHLGPMTVVRVAKRNGIDMSKAQVSTARWFYGEAVKALAPNGVLQWHGKPLKLRPDETAAGMVIAKSKAAAPKTKGHRGKSYSVPARPRAERLADAVRSPQPAAAPQQVRVPTGIATGAYEQQLRRLVMRMGFDAAYAYFTALRTELDAGD